MDPSKVEAIQTWPEPKSTTEVRSFHGLASFYMMFIKDFDSVIAPITKCLNKGVFKWTKATQITFKEVK